uniref:Reverse transcriptase domain-containing protein n=1 Tax=Cannabis sativa TaxID=3483 RepID=A0A803PT45_CANSA
MGLCGPTIDQGAFVKGKSIVYNILILQDLLKNYKRKNYSPRCTIKINISKAYDTVNWDFLEQLLNAYCFPKKFISWVMICVRNTSYILLMNGRFQCNFKGEQGLRQGDPISPLLFVLIMEYLSRKFQLATKEEKFSKCWQVYMCGWDFQVGPVISSAGVLGSGVCNSIS